MKLSSVYILAAFVVALTFPLQAKGGSVINGELVVTNASERQFRVVDQPGYFRAPGGVPLEALDGKPVIVELADNRRVLSITENPIHVDPVTSVYETVTGKLLLEDAQNGIFAIEGAPQTYVAPRGVDLRRYAGQRVELFLGNNGRVLQVDFADRHGDRPATGFCSYNGRGYNAGATLCQTGTEYRCEGGTWRNLGTTCAGGGDLSCSLDGTSYSHGAARCENGVRFVCDDGRWQYNAGGCVGDVTAHRSRDTCTLGGATLAEASSICRDGVTFRCTNGKWINIGTACR